MLLSFRRSVRTITRTSNTQEVYTVARTLARSFAVAATALGFSAAAAGAQAFNFNTTGYFTSAAPTCNQPAPGALTVTCASPTSTLQLTFTGREWSTLEPGGFANGSIVTLGNFLVSGNGSATPTPTSVMFTLVINQTMPSVGTGMTSGYITGTISRPVGGASFSDLVWTPTEIVNIPPTTYDLIFRDDVNGIPLSAVGMTTIEAVGTTVPEPSTVILLGSGIAGLGLFGLRNRQRTNVG